MLSGCIMGPPAIYIPGTHPPGWLLSDLFMEWIDRPSQGPVISADKTDSSY
jgi:hypothetical protein